MSTNADSPTLIGDDVVGALESGMADRFHCVAAKRARRSSTVAGSDVDGVGRVAEVESPGVISGLGRIGVGARRNGKA